MKKKNVELKCELALKELTDCFSIPDKYSNTKIDVMKFHIVNAISILCMIDDWEVENRSTYFCLSEIDRNLTNYVEERKRKENENVNRRIDRVGEIGEGRCL